ncbi:MAG: flippase-like domain-containing protein [Bacteroidetes bacterium]|nr:flippase-like domain-containing protein [Bacteroidota bacterium]MCL2302140.1 flippase-like domain-containing protein [Lentimicrobiaceae bacterium]
MQAPSPNIKSTFSLKRVLIPIAIGIGFSAYSLYVSDFDFTALKGITVSLQYILLALVCMVMRDLMYIIRLRILTEKRLSWLDSWHVVMLWEFASSVTPAVVGGSAFAIYFINQEGLSLGKSTAIIFTTVMLDEIFYIVTVALLLLLLGVNIVHFGDTLPFNPMVFFFIGYGVIIAMTTMITLGIFVAPNGVKKLLVKLFSVSFLKKWQPKMEKAGDELIASSIELKGKSFGYWAKAFIATALTWTARYLTLNFLILALNPELGFHIMQQLLFFAKQLVMWVILLISPTPGASGIAELAFSAFFRNDVPEQTHAAVAVLWRAISYYPYLAVGLIILPIWLRKMQKRKSNR